mmetsp:Transcript_99492/g.276875  ORF Transcript_99492/g.276875 Transcript_99492/m.276875 type:complete len:250 (+) Transcript_99492:112-861(+)
MAAAAHLAQQLAHDVGAAHLRRSELEETPLALWPRVQPTRLLDVSCEGTCCSPGPRLLARQESVAFLFGRPALSFELPRQWRPVSFLLLGSSPFEKELEWWGTRCPSWMPGGEVGCGVFSCGSKQHGFCNKLHPSHMKVQPAELYGDALRKRSRPPVSQAKRAPAPPLPFLPADSELPPELLPPVPPRRGTHPPPRKALEFHQPFHSIYKRRPQGPRPPVLARPRLEPQGEDAPDLEAIGGADVVAGFG